MTMQKSLPLSSPTFSFHGFLRVHAVFLPCAFSCHLDTHGKQRVLPRESFSFLLFPYRNKVKMLISVAKIRQVSEFAKLLAEILSEVAKRRNGSQRWLPFLYSHLWGTGTHTQVPDPMTITLTSVSLFSSLGNWHPYPGAWPHDYFCHRNWFAIPPIFTFPGWSGGFFLSSTKVQNFYHITNQLVINFLNILRQSLS